LRDICVAEKDFIDAGTAPSFSATWSASSTCSTSNAASAAAVSLHPLIER
jgi:hypothetical protein